MKRKSTPQSVPSAARRSVEPPDPFRFGWRYRHEPDRNGPDQWVRVPLTPEDVLHPQENDTIPENTLQERDRRYLAGVLNWRFRTRKSILVLSDCVVDWGVAGLRNHSPDIVVFDDVTDRERLRHSFSVVREGARPLFVIEIVSVDPYDPKIRNNDVVIKVKQYYQAGVPLYFLIDMEKDDCPRRLIGYRRGTRGYVKLPLDRQGRLSLGPAKLLLGLRDNRAVCWDAQTGEEIGDFAATVEARQQAEAACTAEAQARQQAEAALAAAQARLHELEAQARRRRR